METYCLGDMLATRRGVSQEELAKDYMESTLHPALGSPPSRNEDPRQQCVVICDGVGTHIGLSVLEAAVELGIEVVLRVPHLSFRLQGEDTVIFSVLKVRTLHCTAIYATCT